MLQGPRNSVIDTAAREIGILGSEPSGVREVGFEACREGFHYNPPTRFRQRYRPHVSRVACLSSATRQAMNQPRAEAST